MRATIRQRGVSLEDIRASVERQRPGGTTQAPPDGRTVRVTAWYTQPKYGTDGMDYAEWEAEVEEMPHG